MANKFHVLSRTKQELPGRTGVAASYTVNLRRESDFGESFPLTLISQEEFDQFPVGAVFELKRVE